MSTFSTSALYRLVYVSCFWRFFVGLSHSVVVFYLHKKYFPKTSIQFYSFCCIFNSKKQSPINLQRFNNYYFTTSEETKMYSGFIFHLHIQFYIILRKLGVLNMIVISYILCLNFCILTESLLLFLSFILSYLLSLRRKKLNP